MGSVLFIIITIVILNAIKIPPKETFTDRATSARHRRNRERLRKEAYERYGIKKRKFSWFGNSSRNRDDKPYGLPWMGGTLNPKKKNYWDV